MHHGKNREDFSCCQNGHGGGHRPQVSCVCVSSRMERFMEPCLLLLLLEKPSHGYDLISRLVEFGFGENQDPGMVYRNLRRLEEQGMISSRWDTAGAGPARRFYEVTGEGTDYLAAWAQTIRQHVKTLEKFLERYEALRKGEGPSST